MDEKVVVDDQPGQQQELEGARQSVDLNELGQLRQQRLMREKQVDAAPEVKEEDNQNGQIQEQEATPIIEEADPVIIEEALQDQPQKQPKEQQVKFEEEKVDSRNHSESESKQDKSKEQRRSASNRSDAHTSIFECNICLETAREPVVTPCGHLYCWKCIYEWLQQPRATLVCPVCKSGISKEKLTPIFTKDSNEDPRKKAEERKQGEGDGSASDIPNRPGGQREEPQPNANYRGNPFYQFTGNQSHFPIFFGFGGLPTIISIICGILWEGMNGFRRYREQNPQEDSEEMMKRFVFIFMLFMLLCLACFGSDVLIIF